tara:strand:+ start:342 stop:1262 length:921 start_codon:yes stop_codon:yes gene_type:complete
MADAYLDEQKRQAALAEQKEAERVARVKDGMARINAIYDGGSYTAPSTTKRVTERYQERYANPNYRSANRDWPGPPSMYIGRDNNINPAYTEYMRSKRADQPRGEDNEGRWVHTPASGDRYLTRNATRTVDKNVAGATTSYGGIGNSFYDGYKKAYTDYYNPQLEERYGDAAEANFYNFVRNGNAQSKAYADSVADLSRQKSMQQGQIVQNAESEVARMRSRVADEKANAIRAVQTLDDPTQAVNAALTEVNNIQTETPNTSPLGQVFELAALGVGNAAAANARSRYANQVPTSNPYRGAGKAHQG